MASLVQDDFSGGIFRGRRAPKSAVYDAVNALVSDEGELFRRGGSTYKSGSNADDTLLGMWEGHTVGGQRTVFWSDSSPYVLDSNDSSILDLGTAVPSPAVRGVELGGLVFLAADPVGEEVVYAGSRKTSDYTDGQITGTQGSATVTGTSTAFLANVDPGMLVVIDGGSAISIQAVVKSVESDTSLTLTRPLGVSSLGTTAYFTPIHKAGYEDATGVDLLPPRTTAFLAVAGGRLLRARDNRVYYSRPVDSSEWMKVSGVAHPATIEDVTTDYHELPQGAPVTGAASIEDTAILFTTAGVWAISNLALDPVDAFGNIQHQVRQISQDVILWGDSGIAARENVLIVPAIDDVYAFTLGAQPVPLSAGIRPLYREYVEAGYKPGTATVFRGHYILPILSSSNGVIDTLVCRLDRGPAWVRWANGASGRAYARRVGATTREPKLLGLDNLRVSDLTGCFDPDSTRKDDADGTDHALTVTTRDYPLNKGLQKGHVIRVRVNASLVDAATDNPTQTMQWSRGPEGSSFTTVTATRGGGESDGTEFSSWPINKAAEFIRFKWATSGAAASATLRRIEVLFRPFGKQ